MKKIDPKQSYRIGLGTPISKNPNQGFIIPLKEHQGPVLTREEMEGGMPGMLSLRMQIQDAKSLLESKQILRDEGPFDDRQGYVRQFNELVDRELNSISDEERLAERLKMIVDLLKPIDMPGEEWIESEFGRKYQHPVYTISLDHQITYKKEGPLLAGDVLDPEKGRIIRHDELERNVFAVNNILHPVIVGISSLRMSDENYPAYVGIARMKNPDMPSGVEKHPLITVINPNVYLEDCEPLALLCPFSRDFPVTDSIEILSDKAVMSWLLADGAYNRIINMTERMMEKTGLDITDDGSLVFEKDGAYPLEKASAVFDDDGFITSTEQAGKDFAASFELWPDLGNEHSHIRLPFEGALNEIHGFCHSLIGASREYLEKLPEIIGLQVDTINQHIKNVKTAERAGENLGKKLREVSERYGGSSEKDQ